MNGNQVIFHITKHNNNINTLEGKNCGMPELSYER